MEQPGLKLALIGDAGTSGGNFTYYATTLAQSNHLYLFQPTILSFTVSLDPLGRDRRPMNSFRHNLYDDSPHLLFVMTDFRARLLDQQHQQHLIIVGNADFSGVHL